MYLSLLFNKILYISNFLESSLLISLKFKLYLDKILLISDKFLQFIILSCSILNIFLIDGTIKSKYCLYLSSLINFLSPPNKIKLFLV